MSRSRSSTRCARTGSIPGRSYRGFQHIERTDDGGHTWTRLPFYAKLIVVSVIRRIACQGNTLLALESNELRRSDDLGAAPWDVVPVPPYGGTTSQYSHFEDVAFGASKLFALVDHFDVGYAVHASLDRGLTWTAPLFTFPEEVDIVELIAATDSRLVALARQYRDGLPPLYTPWTSDDGGATFVATNDQAIAGLDTQGQVRLQVDVLRPQRVMAVGTGVLKLSLDGGFDIPHPDRPCADATTDPCRPGCVRRPTGTCRSSSPRRIYGVLRSDDGGATFLPVNRGLPGARMGTLHAALHQGQRYQLASSMSGWNEEFYESRPQRRRGADGNRWVSGRRRSAWSRVIRSPRACSSTLSVSAVRTLARPGTFRRRRTSTTFVRFTTHDGVPDSPISWRSLLPVGFSATPGSALLVRPNEYVQLPSGSPTAPFSDVGAAAVAPSDSRVIYVAQPGHYQQGSPVSVMRSNDQGVTFAARTAPIVNVGLAELRVDPLDANKLLAVLFSGNIVYESIDGAGSWTPLPAITGATKVYTVTVEAGATPRRIYAGTDDGVFLLVGNATTGSGSARRTACASARSCVDGPAERRTLTIATDRGVWELTQDTAAATLPVFRFYNTQTRTHFYTASQAERDPCHRDLAAVHPGRHRLPRGEGRPHGHRHSGLALLQHADGNALLHRVRRPSARTCWRPGRSSWRRASCTARWRRPSRGRCKLFRFFNTETGAHFTTTEDDERDYVNSRLPMFVDEGADVLGLSGRAAAVIDVAHAARSAPATR